MTFSVQRLPLAGLTQELNKAEAAGLQLVFCAPQAANGGELGGDAMFLCLFNDTPVPTEDDLKLVRFLRGGKAVWIERQHVVRLEELNNAATTRIHMVDRKNQVVDQTADGVAATLET